MLLAAVGAVVYYGLRSGWLGAEQPLPSLSLPLEPEAAPKARTPTFRASGAGPAARLPSLADSDGALQDALAGLFGPQWLGDLLHRSDLVRRFVVTVDNLPRRALPSHALLFKSPAGPFLATSDAPPLIAPQNAARYRPYVLFAEAVDAKKLVDAYVYFYPLFEEEYRVLGYPSGRFNDRVIEAIDDLLMTPGVDGPVQLAQPRVMYEFADPDLEGLSAGEKIMLRIGPENAAKVKTKLREIRRALAARMPAS
jgi:hypothetical protein